MSEQTKIGGLTREEHVELVRSALPAACFYAFDSLLASAFRLAEVERETIERCARVAEKGCGLTDCGCARAEVARAIRALPLTTGEGE